MRRRYFCLRDFKGISSILIVLGDETDYFLLRYARRILRDNADVTVQIIDINKLDGRTETVSEGIQMLTGLFGSRVKLSKITRLHAGYLEKFSFLMISYVTWEGLIGRNTDTQRHTFHTDYQQKKQSVQQKQKKTWCICSPWAGRWSHWSLKQAWFSKNRVAHSDWFIYICRKTNLKTCRNNTKLILSG